MKPAIVNSFNFLEPKRCEEAPCVGKVIHDDRHMIKVFKHERTLPCVSADVTVLLHGHQARIVLRSRRVVDIMFEHGQ
jgi:hypothetical protein